MSDESSTPNSVIKVGDTIQVRAIEGRNGRAISRAEDGRIILFDNTDPNSAGIKPGVTLKVRVTRVQTTYIIARKVPAQPPPPPPPQPVPPLHELFKKFLRYSNFIAGEGIKEQSVFSWMEARHNAKKHYMEKFSPNNIGELTENELDSFLYFKNNRAWTMLYRQGKQLLNNFDGTKRNIIHLQDENIPIETRIRDVMRGGKLWVRGFGKNITTGILHTCDSKDQYGVWNNRTEEGLHSLNVSLKLSYSDPGISYSRVNFELNKLKELINTDLIMLDGFMWYISKKTNYARACVG